MIVSIKVIWIYKASTNLQNDQLKNKKITITIIKLLLLLYNNYMAENFNVGHPVSRSIIKFK